MNGFSGRAVLIFVIVYFSRGCSGIIPISVLALLLAVSLAVSDDTQNYSGNLLHPI